MLELPASTTEQKKNLWETLAAAVQENTQIPMHWSESDKILPQHIPIFLLKAQGFSISEISEQVSMSKGTVGAVLRSAVGVRMMTQLYTEIGVHGGDDIIMRTKQAAGEALDTIIDVMRTGDDTLRMKSAMTILDRAGYGSVQKSESTVKVEISDERADSLEQALKEAFNIGEAEFQIIEVPVSDEE